MKKSEIPKIIHYCWFGNNPMPEIVKKCIKSWKNKCPEYKIVCWNEKNFDINSNEYVRQAYEAKKWAFVTDYVRLYVIYNYGGIYLDTDVEIIKKIDEFTKYDAFFAMEDDDNYNTGIGFGAKEKHPLVKQMLEMYNCRKFKTDNGFDTTPCPVLNTEVIKNNYDSLSKDKKTIIDNICFLPKDYFCPIDYDTGEMKMTYNTVAIHHFSQSWLSKKEKVKYSIKKKLYKIFGKEKVNKIIKKLKR